MIIRKAEKRDIDGVEAIYSDIHTAEEIGRLTIGWQREIYPTRSTAEAALKRGDLFVEEDNGQLVATAIINQTQVDVYYGANWQYPAADNEVMVLHTLVVSPKAARRGYGRDFLAFYENCAREQGCKYLRIDTNERNSGARAFYKRNEYKEVDVVPCVFNGLEGVRLVLMEKKL